MKSRTLRKANLAFLLFGLVLLGVLVVRLDADRILESFVEVGWNFGLAFAAYVATLILSTLAWRKIIDPQRSTASLTELLASFWAGHAMNGLTPAGLGEVLKGTMLARRMDGEEIVASIVTYNYLTGAAVVGLTVLGPALCLLLLDLPGAVVWTLFGITAGLFVALLLVRAALRRGAAEPIVRFVGKVPFVHLDDPDDLERRAAEVDRRIRVFRRSRPRAFARAVGYVAAVRVFQVLELWFLLVPLLPTRSVGWTLLLALLTRSASQIVAWATAFVPGRIGVLEGGTTLFFRLLGLDPVVGLSAELLRRLRKVIGIAVGLGIGAASEVRSRVGPETKGDGFEVKSPPR